LLSLILSFIITIYRLRLDERTAEFERLRLLQAQESEENSVLKSRFEELKAANEREKMELETQMKQLIHSQAGEFAQETKKFSILQTGLQDELKRSHHKILEQEKEILWLKK